MRNLLLMILLTPAICSCIEELDEQEREFEKIYGFNGDSNPRGIIKSSDGSYIIYGSADKTILDMTQNYEGDFDKEIPFLTKVDQYGSEIKTKLYPLSGLQFSYPENISEMSNRGIIDGKVAIDYAYIDGLVELSDGRYLAIFFAVDKEFYGYDGYFILDQSFDIQEVKLLGDSKIELQENWWVYRGLYKPFTSPVNGKLYAFSSLGVNIDSISNRPNYFFYSLLNFTEDGDLNKVYDYTKKEESIIANDFVLKDDNIITVLGESTYSGSKAYFHQIDLENGQTANFVVVDNGSSTGRKFGKIEKTENGYVTANIDLITHYGILMKFYNNNFELMDTVFHQPSFNNACRISDFISMQDGGFCLLYWDCTPFITVLRLDKKGNELWKWDWTSDPGEGAIYTAEIIETDDGGILYLGAKNFNSSGTKISLIKLDADGKIKWD